MDALLSEINNKRKDLRDPVISAHGNKYIRRADLDRAREEEAKRQADEEASKKRQEREKREKEKLDRLSLLKKGSGGSGRRSTASPSPAGEGGVSRDGTPGSLAGGDAAVGSSTKPEAFNISSVECIRRLRSKGQPILLFGEDEKDRRLRLRALELLEERGGGAAHQGLNDWKKAMEQLETDMTSKDVEKRNAEKTKSRKGKEKDPLSRLGGGARGGTETPDGSGAETGEDEQDAAWAAGQESGVKETAGGAAKRAIAEQQVLDLDLVKTDPKKVYPLIYYALKGLLKEWGQALDDRPDVIKQSHQGKTAAATQVQTGQYLKPLFKSLRARELEHDVLRLLAEIVHYAQKRQYQNANDAYLRLSIGNAAWPIGVTMVGIHARSAREKIGIDSVAHVLNDEVSRKYIQSVKRLLTFAQTIRPPDDAADLMG